MLKGAEELQLITCPRNGSSWHPASPVDRDQLQVVDFEDKTLPDMVGDNLVNLHSQSQQVVKRLAGVHTPIQVLTRKLFQTVVKVKKKKKNLELDSQKLLLPHGSGHL